MLFNLKRGFSTAELLVTIMIFSFGILPLIVLFQNSHKQTAQAKNLMIAQSIGRTIISDIRSRGFDNIVANKAEIEQEFTGDFAENNDGKLVPTDENSIIYPEYYKKFKTVLEIPTPDDSAKVLSIQLTVKWKESTREFDIGFGTLVVKYDT